AAIAHGAGRRLALQQSPDRRHQLVGLGLGRGRGLAPAGQEAVAGGVVEQAERDLVERGLDRAQLGEHVDAVAVLVDHPGDAADLALDARQPGEELVLGCRVSACGGHRSSIIPMWGIVARVLDVLHTIGDGVVNAALMAYEVWWALV